MDRVFMKRVHLNTSTKQGTAKEKREDAGTVLTSGDEKDVDVDLTSINYSTITTQFN